MSAVVARKRVVAVVAVAFGLASFVVSCGSDADPVQGSTTAIEAAPVPTTTEHTSISTQPPTTTPAVTTTSHVSTTAPGVSTTDVSTTVAVPVETTQANVYWSWSVLNPSTGSPERIGAGTREVDADVPVRNSLEALFDGLTAVEQTTGMGTSIPPGTRVLGISVDGTTATVDLSAEFASSSGSLDETIRLAQVVVTAYS